VTIAAGAFEMGSTRSPEEQPVHRVALRAFEIDATEVTAAEYAECVRAGACEATWDGANCNAGKHERANHPVNCVSWFQADAYCRWRNSRLPSEEEWEYAARGVQAAAYPWGAEPPDPRVCWKRWSPRLGTCPVASFDDGKSPFGLFDMAGNVWEWTASGFSDSYEKPRTTKERVLRGGGWGDVDASTLSVTARGRAAPNQRGDTHGFRCASSVER
jgi:formylglycine-generating enzyme required for sulfatase activity